MKWSNVKRSEDVKSALLLVVGAAALGLLHVPAAFAQGGVALSSDHSLEAYIGQEAFQALYMRDADFGSRGPLTARVGMFFNEERDLVGVADVLATLSTSPAQRNWIIQVGPRIYGALLNQEDEDVFGIAIGGQLGYRFGRNSLNTISVNGFYAPDISTFGDADSVADVGARFEYQVQDTVFLFVGYRNVEIDLPVNRELDDGVHVGIRALF